MTQTPLKILGISGSMREKAFSAVALRAVLEAAERHGNQVRTLDLRTAGLPVYADQPVSPEIQAVREQTHWADVFVIASPDYHGSMSGAVKNFFDYHWREFGGKLFGYLCASHEKGLTAMDQLRTTVRQCYGWSLPYGAAINGDADCKDGQIVNESLKRRLDMMARDLSVYGRILRDQLRADLSSTATDTFVARYR